MKRINFDHASATPVLPEALESMRPFFGERFGNPQSIHALGQQPLTALELAREQVAGLVNAQPSSIVFTASASESNNLAVKGLALARKERGRHIVVSAIEHRSVLGSARVLQSLGFELTELKVDRFGLVAPDVLEQALRPDTVLVAVMHANNEIGTIEPLGELVQVCRRHGVLLHSDGTAAVGRIPVDVRALGVDSYAFPAQSFFGPKGAAALYLKTGTRTVPLIDGGAQERGRRGGTENVPAVVGMGRAAEVCRENLANWSETMESLGRKLASGLNGAVDHVVFTGHPTNRLPGHVSLCVEFVEGEALLLSLDDEGFAAASGSACTEKTLKASHVLLAIGLDHAVAQGSLVLTLGMDNTEAEVDEFTGKLPAVVERLRSMSPLYAKYLKGEDPYAFKDQTLH